MDEPINDYNPQEDIKKLYGLFTSLATTIGELEEEKTPKLRQFDPQIILDPTCRKQAWWRLYDFVEYLNSTWGGARNNAENNTWYICSGWWNNPLAVTHLAALAAAYAQAFIQPTHQLAGNSEIYETIVHKTETVLEKICGKNPDKTDWSQNSPRPLHWNITRPPRGSEGEENRFKAFQNFVEEDSTTPLPEARHRFYTCLLQNMNPLSNPDQN